MENSYSFVDHTSAGVVEEIENLKLQLQQQTDLIESQKQEMYSTHKRLECMTKMKFEMEIEIEALNGLHKINGNLELKVKELERDLTAARNQSCGYENQLLEERNTQEQLASELRSQVLDLQNKLTTNDEKKIEEAVNELQSKCDGLKEENLALVFTNEDLLTNNEELNVKVTALETILGDKQHECEELKEILQVKSDALKNTQQLNEELQEEKHTMNEEIIKLKNAENKSTDSKGNSLFAEVDDNRVKVTAKLTAMQNKYKELRSSYVKKNAELKSLEAENNELRKKWNEHNDVPYKTAGSLIEDYKNRISELVHRNTELEKRPESPQIITLSNLNDGELKCIKAMIDYERNQNRELAKEMEQTSIRALMQGEELFRIRQDLRNMNSKVMQNDAIIVELRQELETYKRGQLLHHRTISNKMKRELNEANVNSDGTIYNGPPEKMVRFDESVGTECARKPENNQGILKKSSIYDKAQIISTVKVQKENVP